MSIIACNTSSDTIRDPAPLAWVISRMTPGLCTPGLLAGETADDALARRLAAADILDDLLSEYAEAVAS